MHRIQFPKIILISLLLLILSCTTKDEASTPQIKLPSGFKISIYAENIPNARSMELSESGILFVSTRTAGNVYALIDNNKDYKVDEVITIATGLNMPNGVALKDGDLYVAEVSRIIKFPQIEKNLRNNPSFVVI
ncbi:MAG: sorbosone dehydrogenase family protein, partial [Ignavibacterium sp.]